MSDPTEPLRRALDTARAIQADIDELGVSKPAAPPPSASEDIRAIIQCWRNMVEKRGKFYSDTPGDFLGRMLLDEVATVDAWLKEQDGGAAK